MLESISALREALDYHAARHNLLVANMAHIDTPGFRPLDLERRSEFASVMNTTLATDSADGGSPAEPAWNVVESADTTAGLDGNHVDLDRESVKLAANQVRYDMIAQLVASQLGSMSWAANDGRAV